MGKNVVMGGGEGKLKELACHSTKKVNKAEKLTREPLLKGKAQSD
jgi:hypothetical protein